MPPMFGQMIENDTSVTLSYFRTYYVPRVGLSYQKSPLLELGICRQWSARGDKYSKTVGYYGKDFAGYFGTYLSVEAVLQPNNIIYGIKLGAETVLVGGASLGIILGLETTDYIYQAKHYLCLTPKIVVPLTLECTPLGFFSYGYCVNDFNLLSDAIGNHRFSLILNFCFKEHKQINRMHKDFRNSVNRIQANGS